MRATSFGPYVNPIGLATIRVGEQAVVVTSAEASGNGRGFPRALHERAPGSVVSIEDERLVIAAGRGTVALTGFADLRGAPLSARAVVRRLDLQPGGALETYSPAQQRRLTELGPRTSRGEASWVQRLSALDPLTLPCPVAARAPGKSSRAAVLDVRVPAELRSARSEQPFAALLTAAFVAYLGRLARRERFDVGSIDAELRQECAGLEALVATRLPLRVELRAGETCAELAARLEADVKDSVKRGPWLRDVLARHPVLSGLAEEHPAQLLPVGVETCARFETPLASGGGEGTLEICAASSACRFVYDAERVHAVHAQSLVHGFEVFLASVAAQPSLAHDAHPTVDEREIEQQFVRWNPRGEPKAREACIHELFFERARLVPDATALAGDGASLTYAELEQRVTDLALRLRSHGVERGVLVGVCVDRSLDLPVALLAVQAAGGAYVPLDPAFPAARVAFMIEDAGLGLILTQEKLAATLPEGRARILCIDAQDDAPRELCAEGLPARPDDLAYVIYTSGSTGKPKGVQIEHRQVASFFAAIDERVPHEPPGVWLAVTSLSFDISVLELLWTLTRGFKVVLHAGLGQTRTATPRRKKLDFSLFYFGSDDAPGKGDAYRLLLEGARFADEHDFHAVWTPERHFHAFGGPYPNPALTGAALAAITRRVEIRAGSVVLPLHHPIRVAEEWAVVDNLSGGRVGLSFASGWHPNDFVLAPHNHAQAKDVMLRDIEVVQRLWRGETVEFPGPGGTAVGIRTLPRPVRAELPVWITSAGSVATYKAAGKLGANVLTHLLGQSVEELALKIAAYRDARAGAGFDPATGVVTLMLHTFVGEDEERARAAVLGPLERYLASSLSLVGKHASSFPAFRGGTTPSALSDQDVAALEPEERAALLAHARDRYYETSGLFGGPQRCAETVDRLRSVGVDEIACLIDFGVPVEDVLASLPHLDRVRRRAQAGQAVHDAPAETSLGVTLRTEGVTHVQCTPSLARILCSDPETRAALRAVPNLFVGGEALPEALARELATLCGSVTNMYGPTETTIWSSTQTFDARGVSHDGASATVPIGKPLSNTSFYVLDAQLQPLPIGVAGELVIGGSSVARGYLGRPELDAQRFVPDPWSSVHGARVYRTGDLARWRADGVVEFLGRTDQQIKVRGHRIEPGEIEHVLASEASVAEALVVARDDAADDRRLLAYVVPRGAAPDPKALRALLAAQLPEYMVPAQIFVVAAIPRTPNGKIDRGALAPPRETPRAQIECTPPENELETRLAVLWQETLGVERVGVDDNFFDLGGHSLLAVRIHRRLAELVHVGELSAKPISLTDLFRFPTIRALARFLGSDAAQGGLDAASLRGRSRRASMSHRRQSTSET
ncbi:MAG TPA: MupA/Atu3671 family FMN-dependent luciferase-like monooxygenase [Planctomycetota bacterium]|nr:MupA/Atu3671 family FMN-dependent luciferase-like monooxygenase [Planctomycetota bacterium]